MNLSKQILLVPILGLAVCHSAVQSSRETPVQAPVIRAESRLVVVDAIVTDRAGSQISNIAPGEFHVWEDDKEQSIKSVSHESGATPDSRSYVVLFFGKMSPSELVYTRDKAWEFIRNAASPNRLIALVNYMDESGNLKLTQGFTSDVVRLRQAAASIRTAGATEQDAAGDPVATQAMISPEGPTADGSPPSVAAQAKRYAAYNLQTQQSANNNQVSGLSLLDAVRDVARNLSSLPGRKALVLMAPQFQYNLRPEDISPIVDACNMANVTVYTIDVRADTSSVPENGLEQLLDSTGGFGTDNPNDTLGALNRIASEQSNGYVLTYSPPKSLEGSCHSLKVTLDHPGAKVRARRAYCNATPNGPLAETSLDRALDPRTTGGGAGTLSAAVQSAFFYVSPTSARVQIAAEVSTDGLNFEKRNGRFHATLNVRGIAYKPDGKAGAGFSDTVDFDFENKIQVELFKRNPYRYERQFAATPGKYDFRLAFSSGSGSFARAQAPLVIDRSDGKHLAVGGLALCAEIRNAAASVNSLSLLADQVPLVSQGLQYVPSGSARIRRTNTVGVYFELYEPDLQEEHPTVLKFRIRVLDRRNGSVMLDSEAMSIDLAKWSSPVIPVGWKLAMDKLASGPYRLLVVALDSNGAAPPRTADFEVE